MGILAALLDALNLTLDGHLEKGETVFLQCTIMKTVDNLAMRVPVCYPISRVFSLMPRSLRLLVAASCELMFLSNSHKAS